MNRGPCFHCGLGSARSIAGFDGNQVSSWLPTSAAFQHSQPASSLHFSSQLSPQGSKWLHMFYSSQMYVPSASTFISANSTISYVWEKETEVTTWKSLHVSNLFLYLLVHETKVLFLPSCLSLTYTLASTPSCLPRTRTGSQLCHLVLVWPWTNLLTSHASVSLSGN